MASNRAVFIEILTTDEPSEVIEKQMLAYLERNQGMSYKEPISIPSQLVVSQTNTPLEIIADSVRLISDKGSYGHQNKAIDAGETIELNIPLKNISDSPFRSTSGFLETDDEYIRIGKSEVLYRQGGDINAIPGVLNFAARFGYINEIEFLIEKGAKLNGNDPPLWFAMQKNEKGNELEVTVNVTQNLGNRSAHRK